MYQRDLDKDLQSELSGDFLRLMRSVASGNRENMQANLDLADKEARELYAAGEKKIGTDENEFVRIMCHRSFDHLSAINHRYSFHSKRTLTKAIESEMSGDLSKLNCFKNSFKDEI